MTTPLSDEQIIMKHDPAARPRARMELKIVSQFLADAEVAGFYFTIGELEVDDDETENDPPYGYPSIRDAIFDLDDAHVELWRNGKRQGSVYFVFGNDGYDCISDYTTNLESFLRPCLDLSERLENGLE